MASTADSGVDRWFIGGGAEHTPESARRQLYAATGGAEGVGGPNDLLVRPLTPPGQGVRVAIGSGLALSRYNDGVAQTYMGTAYREQILATVPTGSAAGRSDLVVMRVRDPHASSSPWPKPPAADIPHEQYVYFEVISGVPAGTKKLQTVPGRQNDTGIALARIDFPKSTGTVDNGTGAKIVDLREVARPRRSEVVYARPRIGSDEDTRFLTVKNANGGEYFPGGQGDPNQIYVDVPPWATRLVIDASWMSIIYAGGQDPRGYFWVEYGDQWKDKTWPNKQNYQYATQKFLFNSTNSPDARTTDWHLMDEVPIPAHLRGKELTLVFKAGRDDTMNNSAVSMNSLGGLGMRLTFAERAVDDDML